MTEFDNNGDQISEKQTDHIKQKNDQGLFSILHGYYQKSHNLEKFQRSQYLHQYLRELQIDSSKQIIYTRPFLQKQIETNLNQNNIKYHPSNFKQTKIEILDQTPKCTVVMLKVTIGYFTLEISILNKLQQINHSYTSQKDEHQIEGSFGKVVFKRWEKAIIKNNQLKNLHSQSIIKFVQKVLYFQRNQVMLKQPEYHYDKISHYIFEYCLSKIASILKVGIKIQLIYGFDLICYSNCILFCMEQGLPLNKTKFRTQTKQSQKILKENLKILHSLKIVHNDIKYDNIVYCQSFKKVVFIDFGLSETVDEQVGMKTQSVFKGSFYFVSQEMKNLIIKKNGYVDLYYNDLHCLKKSISFINISQKETEQFSYTYRYSFSSQIQQKIVQQNLISGSGILNQKEQTQLLQNKQNLKSLSIIPAKQDQIIDKFDIQQSKCISYQLFYLLHNKKIKQFSLCLSQSNKINQNQRIWLMNEVMHFLQEIKGFPIYDQIYNQNYYNYLYNKQYESLKIENKIQQSDSLLRFNSFQLLSKRYILINEINFSNKIQKQKQNQKVLKQIYKTIQYLKRSSQTNLTSYNFNGTNINNCNSDNNISYYSQNFIDLSQMLQNIYHQSPQIQQNICCLLIYIITLPYNFYNSFNKKISKLTIKIFKTGIIKLFQNQWLQYEEDQKFFIQNLNIKLNIKENVINYLNALDQDNGLPLANGFGDDTGFMRKSNNKKNQVQRMINNLVFQFVQYHIIKFQHIFLPIIIKNKIDLQILPPFFYQFYEDSPYDHPKINFILINFANYCNCRDIRNLIRSFNEIKAELQKMNKIKYLSSFLIILLRQIGFLISFRSNVVLINQLQNLIELQSKSQGKMNFNFMPQKIQQNNQVKVPQHLFDYNSSPYYKKFWIDYMKIQSYVHKGMSDFNVYQLNIKFQQLKTRLNTFCMHIYKHKGFNIYFQLQHLNIVIYDQLDRFQDVFQLNKDIVHKFPEESKSSMVFKKLFMRSYSMLGVQMQRYSSMDLKGQINQNNRKQNILFNNQTLQNLNIQKILLKQTLQSVFISKYSFPNKISKQKCLQDYNRIIKLIKLIKSEYEYLQNQYTLKISMLLSFMKTIFILRLQFLQQLIIEGMKVYLELQFKQNKDGLFYHETLVVLNEIVQEIIKLRLQNQVYVNFQFVYYVLNRYEEYIKIGLQDNKNKYPASYWIIKGIYSKQLKQQIINNRSNIKKSLSLQKNIQILQKLKTYSCSIRNFSHLQFQIWSIKNIFNQVMKKPTDQQWKNISKTKINYKNQSNQKQQFSQQKLNLRNLVEQSIRSILATNRRHIFLRDLQFTLDCLIINDKFQQIKLTVQMFYEICKFIRKFPGKKNIHSLLLLLAGIQQLFGHMKYVQQTYYQLVYSSNTCKYYKDLPQMVPVIILLMRNILTINAGAFEPQKQAYFHQNNQFNHKIDQQSSLSTNKINSFTPKVNNFKFRRDLRNIAIAFHSLNSSWKTLLYCPYYETLYQFYQKTQQNKKQRKLLIKYMRKRRKKQYIHSNSKLFRFSFWIQQINKLTNLQIHRRINLNNNQNREKYYFLNNNLSQLLKQELFKKLKILYQVTNL